MVKLRKSCVLGYLSIHEPKKWGPSSSLEPQKWAQGELFSQCTLTSSTLCHSLLYLKLEVNAFRARVLVAEARLFHSLIRRYHWTRCYQNIKRAKDGVSQSLCGTHCMFCFYMIVKATIWITARLAVAWWWIRQYFIFPQHVCHEFSYPEEHETWLGPHNHEIDCTLPLSTITGFVIFRYQWTWMFLYMCHTNF